MFRSSKCASEFLLPTIYIGPQSTWKECTLYFDLKIYYSYHKCYSSFQTENLFDISISVYVSLSVSFSNDSAFFTKELPYVTSS